MPTARARTKRIPCAGRAEHPFKCSRHRKPEQNLRPGNEKTTSTLVATRLNGLTSCSGCQRVRKTGSGFAFGTRLLYCLCRRFPGGDPASADC